MKKTLMSAALALCLFTSAAPAQTQNSGGPELVARDFYAWYTGSLDREDYNALKRRREALRYLTADFHRRAPHIIAEQMVDIFICAQDWQPGWADGLKFSAGPVRGNRAQVTATFDYGPENQARVRLSLLRVGGAWKINGADCLPPG